jgi:hypothetical protein
MVSAERKIWIQDDEATIYEDKVKELARPGSLNAGRKAGYAAKPLPPLTALVIADSDFRCVKRVVAGAKVGFANICSIKQAHASFPKNWVTTDAWFRLKCALLGITVIGAMLVFFSSVPSRSVYKSMRPADFANCLAYHILTYFLPGYALSPRSMRTAP